MGANSILDLPSEEFLRAMRTDGLADRWTDLLYSNGNDTFIQRVIHKNNEAGKDHNLEETRKCMIEFLEQNPHLIRHPDGLLFWARECEKRAEALVELRDDDEALRKYLVVNESNQKFLELWRMSQIQVLRDFESNPNSLTAGQMFRSESARVPPRDPKAKRSPRAKKPLPPILSREGTMAELFTEVDPEEISRRRSIHVTSPTRSRAGTVDSLQWRSRSRAPSRRGRSYTDASPKKSAYRYRKCSARSARSIGTNNTYCSAMSKS